MSRGEADVLERQLEARDPDVRLMLQVKDDVPAAFEALVQRYQDRLVGLLYHLVGNRQEAEDLTRDTFLRVYKSRKGYRPRAKFSTWLYTIANNLAFNYIRRKAHGSSSPAQKAHESSQAQGALPHELPSRESTASSQVRKIELAEVVQDALKILGEDQRLAVFLSKFEEMSYAEIAEVMNRSPTAIKSLLARARNELREHLQPYAGFSEREAERQP